MSLDNVNDIEELRYLKDLKNGRREAFDFIYARYSKMLLPKMQRMIKSNEIVDELMQDVFLKIWLHKSEINLDKSFKGWIFKVAQNTIYAYYRKLALDAKMQKHILETFAAFYDQTEDYIFNKERISLLNEAIEKLPPQRKEIFKLCRMEGKTYQEAAEILSLSASTVSNQLVSATKYIKRYVFFHNQEFILFCIAAYLNK
ncbi:RNA polymerase sigma-70 factor (ECF subfamily) [Pedobacter psychrotolerans]|uniref:DNA-directed RNA polymerase sigma-70 factor n=1 Tax=Pedobacter psychrotolerans TaxID=1843235 RepID=A0A4R2H6P6_9SPHI|nr:sigma-70 family RNA polymerase sigma factor [Pedobacter psychrotolerans]TCO21482.1 RNA polymerase sigma-70 factor (ECF subfamily) [Pedobacter psychrotolerans]GGE38981.1 DNA-directed RNA polymerase sigma-70 factor [Pedobacter psychrotolerans]